MVGYLCPSRLISYSNNRSEDYLLRAKEDSCMDGEVERRCSWNLRDRTLKNQLIYKAYMLYSMLELERGSPHNALAHAKQGVRLLRRAWATTERVYKQYTPGDASPGIEPENSSDESSQLNMSKKGISTALLTGQPMCGSLFWPLITPLLHGLVQLSILYAHHGMFQETMYYAEQAHSLVEEVGSVLHTTMASTYLGSKWLEAGVLDKGSDLLMAAKQLSGLGDKTRNTANLSYHLGVMHGLLGDSDAELAAYDEAETVLSCLSEPNFINGLDSFADQAISLEEEMSRLTISKKKVPAPRKTTARSKTAGKRKVIPRAKSPVENTSSITDECSQIMSMKAVVLRRKARVLTATKKFVEAQSLLCEAGDYSSTQAAVVEHGLAMAKHLLHQSMEQMSSDPVYSVLQESTISFPSIVGHSRTDRSSDNRLSSSKLSPPGKRQAANGKGTVQARSPVPDGFVDKLRCAQDQLTDIHAIALSVAPISVLHTISALLNSVAILLSAAGLVKGKALAHPGFASCSIGKTEVPNLMFELTDCRKCENFSPPTGTKSHIG
jgi:separase